jgi:pseudaminic acid cytidylyltransferase
MDIAVIPARSGSKRIPRKNIKEFCGRPMIAWAISAAIDSNLFEKIIVSTDDAEIAEVAREYGAETPFVRPVELSDDYVGTVPVVAHAINEIIKNDFVSENVCCIYPCTPFLQPIDLIESHSLLRTSDTDFVYPVVEYMHPTYRAMLRTSNGEMQFVFPECELKRTQDLELTYHDAGQFYWGKADAWLANKRMHTAGIGMVFPSWKFVDIDTEDDWYRAELIFRSGSAI